MLHTIGRTAVAQVQSLLHGFLQDGVAPCSSVLTVDDIVALISQTCVETCDRIFTPDLTTTMARYQELPPAYARTALRLIGELLRRTPPQGAQEDNTP